MKIIDAKDSKGRFMIGLVVSRFNKEITQLLLDGATKRLKELGFSEQDITVLWVPGAVEIPIGAQRLAQLGVYDAVVCLGAVIKGGTDHYTYVCQQVSYGCQQVALQNDLPVLFGVLTTENEEQARARAGGAEGNKGGEAIDAAVEIVGALKQLG
jgi:6,7-dimethyl-8-ribityllumazine synthase